MTNHRKTILYVRCSTDAQELEHQIESGQTYAKNNDLTIDSIIKDFGVSAYKTSYTEREGLMEVLTLASQGKVENLIVFSSDRLARHHLEGQIIISQLTQYGVKILSINEGTINQTEIDNLLNSIRFFQNQIESKKTSQRIKSAKLSKAKEGGFLGGEYVLLGYKVINKKLVVDEELRPAIIDFFQTYLNHGNKYTINHMKEKYNIIIKDTCVYQLRNKTYIGYPYKKERADIYIKELQIIPNDLFDKVQKKIDANRTNTNQNIITNRTNFLCEGLMYHTCGQKMALSRSQGKYISYRCRACKGNPNVIKNFSQYRLDDIVDKRVVKWFDNLDKNELERRFHDSRSTDIKSLLIKEKKFNDLLSTKKQTLINANKKLSEAIMKDYPLDMIQILTDSINDLKTGIEDLEQNIQDIEQDINDVKLIQNQHKELTDQLLDFKYLYSQADPLQKKTLIRAIIDKVVVQDYENIEITYKY